MSYYVLVDGVQQGPLGLETVADMVARGEVGPETYVWTAGMDDWVPARDAPELARLFTAQKPTQAAPPPPARVPPATDRPLDIGRALTTALQAVAARFGSAMLVSLIYNVVAMAVAWSRAGALARYEPGATQAPAPFSDNPDVAIVGLIAAVVIMPVIYGGFAAAMLDLVRGGPATVGRLFSGFRRAGALILFWIFYGVGCAVGLVLFVAPAVFVAVTFALTPFIVMESALGPIEAMKQSLRAVMGLGWWRFFALVLLLMLAVMVTSVVTQGVFAALVLAGSPALIWVGQLVSLAVNTAVGAVFAAALAAAYLQALENREREQGGAV